MQKNERNPRSRRDFVLHLIGLHSISSIRICKTI